MSPRSGATGAVVAVIRREYLQRVSTRWFVLTTVGAPVLFLALMLVPAWFGGQDERAERRIVLLDRTGVLDERVAARLGEAGWDVERMASVSTAGDLPPDLRGRVLSGDVAGVLVLDEESLAAGASRWVGGGRPGALRELTLRQAVAAAALEARLQDEPADVEALLAGGSLEVDVLTDDEGADFDDPAFLSAYMGTFLLYMVILFYAVAVMRSVLEEKTNRIVEVVISSMRPWHLMLGKILGVGAVGLTQLGVWALVGGVGVLLGLPALLAARPELTRLEGLREYLPGVGWLALFFVFFLCGYFLYAALYAAIGAMCNSEQEAQQAQTPVVLLLIAPIVLLIGVLQDPDSALAVGASLVPFFSPTLMFARAVVGAAPAWQVVLSIVLMVASVVAVAWLAGRIYRVGILMSGKRPTLPELWRWVRAS